MGMFDEITVEIHLPDAPLDFKPDFQTKSFDPPVMDRYRIDADGILWKQEYEIEDRSDPTAEGIRRMIGMMTRVNKRWVKHNYTGEIRFYDFHKANDEWFEYSVYLERGIVVRGPHRIT